MSHYNNSLTLRQKAMRKNCLMAPRLVCLELRRKIGQLNVASPEAEVADGNTPETGNPVRPKTRELSPSSSVSGSAENSQHNRSHQNQLGKFNRQIDLNLLENEMAYEAELRAREESRAEKKQKAETFCCTTAGKTSTLIRACSHDRCGHWTRGATYSSFCGAN